MAKSVSDKRSPSSDWHDDYHHLDHNDDQYNHQVSLVIMIIHEVISQFSGNHNYKTISRVIGQVYLGSC